MPRSFYKEREASGGKLEPFYTRTSDSPSPYEHPNKTTEYTIKKGDKRYTLSQDDVDWVKKIYKANYNNYYGVDDADLQRKQLGEMPSAFLSSYNGRSKLDNDLYNLGLPSSKHLETYLELLQVNKDSKNEFDVKQNYTNQFKNSLYLQLATAEANKGGALTDDERDEIIYNAVESDPNIYSWFNTKSDYATPDLLERKKDKDGNFTESMQEWRERQMTARKTAEKNLTPNGEADVQVDMTKAGNWTAKTLKEIANQYAYSINYDDLLNGYNNGGRTWAMRQNVIADAFGKREDYTYGDVYNARVSEREQKEFEEASKQVNGIKDSKDASSYVAQNVDSSTFKEDWENMDALMAKRTVNPNSRYAHEDYEYRRNDRDMKNQFKDILQNVFDMTIDPSVVGEYRGATGNPKVVQKVADSLVEAYKKANGYDAIANKSKKKRTEEEQNKLAIMDDVISSIQHSADSIRINQGNEEKWQGDVDKGVVTSSGTQPKKFVDNYKGDDYVKCFEDYIKDGASKEQLKEAKKYIRNTKMRVVDNDMYVGYTADRDEVLQQIDKLYNDFIGFSPEGKQYVKELSALTNENNAALSTVDLETASAVISEAMGASMTPETLRNTVEGLAAQGASSAVIADALNRYTTENYELPNLFPEYQDAFNAIYDLVDKLENDEATQVVDAAIPHLVEMGLDDFEIDQTLNMAGLGNHIDKDKYAVDYFIHENYPSFASRYVEGFDRTEYAKKSEEEQIAEASAVWNSLSDSARQSYVENFKDTFAYNTDINRPYGEQIVTQAGAVVPRALVTIGANTLNFLEMNRALFTKDEIAIDEQWVATQFMNDVNGKLSMLGKSLNADTTSEIIAKGSDVATELVRMYTENKLGSALGGIVNKGLSSHISEAGLSRLVSIASQTPFVTNAMGGYFNEAKQNGASDAEAIVYGGVCGYLEGAVEKLNTDTWMMKGLGGDRVVNQLVRDGGKFAALPTAVRMKTVNLIASVLGETTEEGMSYLASLAMSNLTYKHGGLAGAINEFSWSDLWDEASMGGLVGFFGSGVGAVTTDTQSILANYLLDSGFDINAVDAKLGNMVLRTMPQEQRAKYQRTANVDNIMDTKTHADTEAAMYRALQEADRANDSYEQTVTKYKNELAILQAQRNSAEAERVAAKQAYDANPSKGNKAKLTKATNKRLSLDSAINAKVELYKASEKTWSDNRNQALRTARENYNNARDALNKHWVAFSGLSNVYVNALKDKSLSDGAIENYTERLANNRLRLTSQFKNKIFNEQEYNEAIKNIADIDDVLADAEALAQTSEIQKLASEQAMNDARNGVKTAKAEAQAETAQPATEATPAAESTEATEATAEQPAVAETEAAPVQNEKPKKSKKKADASLDADNTSPRVESTEADRQAIYNLAEKLGLKNVVIEDMGNRDVNGFVQNNVIHINSKQRGDSVYSMMKYTLGHELTHTLQGSHLFNQFARLAESYIAKSDDQVTRAAKIGALMQIVTDQYNKSAEFKKDNRKLSRLEAYHEVMAKFAEEFMFTDDDFINTLVKQNDGIASRVLATIEYYIDRVGARRSGDKAAMFLLDAERRYAVAFRNNPNSNPSAFIQYSQNYYSEDVDRNQPLKKISDETYETSDGGIVTQFSLAYAPKTQAEINKEVSRLVNAGFDEESSKRFVESQTSLAALIANDSILDFEADNRYKAIKDNSDYKQGTVDFINDCVKRRPFSKILAKVQRMNPDRVFDATDLEAIRIILEEEGYPVGCVMCFVDDRRQNMGNRAQEFIDILNGNIPDGVRMTDARVKIFDSLKKAGITYVPQVVDLVNYQEFKNLHDSEDPQKRAIYDAFNKYNGSFGMDSVRLVEGDAEYKREILKWNQKKIDYVNSLGGLRIFSFSDFEAHHLLDIVQIVQDCAEKGVKIQGYTKVPAFAKAVAATGMKVNRSHIAKGTGYHVDANGNTYINHDVRRDENGRVINYNDVDISITEGIDPSDPDFIEANGNIGNNIIGISWEHIRAAMRDKYFHQIIPFHTGLPEERLVQKGIKHWFNFRNFQTEKDASTFSKKENGLYKFKKSEYQCNFYTDVIQPMLANGETITARSFGEKFIEVCEQHGVIPRFWQLLEETQDGDGKLHYKYVDGYEKVLVDYPMFDADGNYVPQEAVQAEFDNDFDTSILTKYSEAEQEKLKPEAIAREDRTVERIINEVVNGDSSQISKASDIDFDADAFSMSAEIDWDAEPVTEQERYTSDFAENIQRAEQISDELKAKVAEEQKKVGGIFDYVPESNRQQLDIAYNVISAEGSLEKASQKFHAAVESGRVNPINVALGERLLVEYGKNGDVEKFMETATDLTLLSEASGRALQAFSILKKLGAAGQAYYINSLVKHLNKQNADRIAKGKMRPIYVSKDKLAMLATAKTQDEINDAMDIIFVDLGSQIPPTLGDRIRAIRYTAMLANPLTHFRNMFGNALMMGMYMAKDAVGAVMDKTLKQENRTHALYGLNSEARKAAKAKAAEVWENVQKDVQHGGKYNEASRIMENKRSFGYSTAGEIAERFSKWNGDLLEAEDLMFLRPAFMHDFIQMMVARGLDPNNMTQEQLDEVTLHAMKSAQENTYRDANWIADRIKNFETIKADMTPTQKAAVKAASVLVEGVIPFKKTPLNILRRGIEYSPAGLVKGGVELLSVGMKNMNLVKEGLKSPNEAINDIAKGLTGSALFLLGTFFASMGMLRSRDEDEDYERLLTATGSQPYSLNVGDASFALSQIAPVAIPLMMGVALYESMSRIDDGEEKNKTLTEILDYASVVADAANPMMEMSFLSSVNEVLSSAGYASIANPEQASAAMVGNMLTTAAKNYVSQFFPTVVAKLVDLNDSTRRTTTGFNNSPLGKASRDYYLKSLKNKTSLARTLQPYVNLRGDTITDDSFADYLLTFANNFVLPARLSIRDTDYVDNELISLYESVGDSDIIPKKAPKKLKQYDLNEDEYTAFSMDYGDAIYASLRELMQSPEYIAANDSEKSTMVAETIKNADSTIKNLWIERVVPQDEEN